MFNKSMKLNNGVVIPQLALGTWLIDDDKVTDAVKSALQMGYRHIDTAQAYGNERGVGEGVRQSGIPRDEIFITSKVAAEHKSYESAAKSIDDTLALMKMDYLDMMIIHSPQPWKEVNQSENRYKKENQEVWRALEDALEAGKLRAIGVSNFLEEDVQNILKTARIKPQVNQILAHISNTPLDLIQYCQNEGIAVEAYSPVAHGEALKNPKIVAMAKKYGVSVAQLCIRYCIQLDMIVLPKTVNPDHMRENADLDFEISQEDMKELLAIDKIQDYGEASFFPVYGGKL
ncbi:aldo/keto reductase [Enterococcus cecorum]|uniref:aldo/keto reductase n=1 Tax=Enterococcus cecorum TaxID=44008 RepID=UPI0022D9E848|nr:aldo/keto reductase [Enterococcus cecorum]CAI3330614.1 aldo/keto reductase [Enterococcus cecorum]